MATLHASWGVFFRVAWRVERGLFETGERARLFDYRIR